MFWMPLYVHQKIYSYFLTLKKMEWIEEGIAISIAQLYKKMKKVKEISSFQNFAWENRFLAVAPIFDSGTDF